jgi:hypothetical protein
MRTPTKELALTLVIGLFGFATKANIEETIEVLNFENTSILNVNDPTDEPYIEANICCIGFLYSALRDMEFHSNDLPLFYN